MPAPDRCPVCDENQYDVTGHLREVHPDAVHVAFADGDDYTLEKSVRGFYYCPKCSFKTENKATIRSHASASLCLRVFSLTPPSSSLNFSLRQPYLSPPPESLFESSRRALARISRRRIDPDPLESENRKPEFEISSEALDEYIDRRIREEPKQSERKRRREPPRSPSPLEYAGGTPRRNSSPDATSSTAPKRARPNPTPSTSISKRTRLSPTPPTSISKRTRLSPTPPTSIPKKTRPKPTKRIRPNPTRSGTVPEKPKLDATPSNTVPKKTLPDVVPSSTVPKKTPLVVVPSSTVPKSTRSDPAPSSTVRTDQQTAQTPTSSHKEAEVTVPWDHNTFQDAEMRRFGLVVYFPLRILICIGCASVIDPNHIFAHVHRDQPHAKITKKYCEELKTRFVLTPKAELERPSTLRSAIPCLQLQEDYAYCTVCNHAVQHERTLTARHTTCEGFRVQKGFAQSFFPRSHSGGYFGVTIPPRRQDQEPIDLVQRLKNTFPDPNPANIPITQPQNPRDANHFLEMQKWVPTLNRLTGAEIHSAIKETDQPLRELVLGAVRAYMSEIDELLERSDHSERSAIGSFTGGEIPTTDLFNSLSSKTAKEAYIRTGVDLVTFLVNACFDKLGEVPVQVEDEQRMLARRFCKTLKRSDDSKVATLQNLLFSVFTQNRGNENAHVFSPYRFLVLSSFRRDGSVEPCNNITQIVSKIVFYARACIYKRIEDTRKVDRSGFFTVYAKVKQYLALNSDFTLSPLYNDRNLLKKLVEDQEHDPKITLVGRTAILHDMVVRLDDIGDMYRALLEEIRSLESKITQGLSDTDNRFQVRLPQFPSDEPNDTHIDFFFADLPRNGFVGVGDAMLDIVVNHERFRNQYIVDTGNDRFSHKPAACFELLQQFSHLRSLLFCAMHISSGSPGRASEISSHYLRNAPGGDVRNVKLINGRICFVGGYNKTTHQTERQKVMYRFPPDTLAPYLLREWLMYRPLQVYIARMMGDEDMAHRLRYFLFPGLYKPLDPGNLTDMLREATMNHLGYEIGLRDWREIELAFVRAFYDGIQNTFVAPAHYAQRGHTVRVGYEYYGHSNEAPNGVPYQVISSHLESSEFWQDLTTIQRLPPLEPGPYESVQVLLRQMIQLVHQMLGMVEEVKSVQKGIPSTVRRTISTLRPDDISSSPSSRPSRCNPPTICPHPSSLTRLRAFRKDEKAEFTCPEQAQALEAVLSGSDHVFLIGPTGMGKTSVLFILATESPQKVIVVLIPLSALRIDFARRCRGLGIACSEWTEGNPQQTTIIMVSPENAVKESFVQFTINLHLRKLLALFALDEVHMSQTHKDFRPCFASHRRLIQSKVPFFLMTATCPPELESEILDSLSIPNCLVIRAATPRPEISYNVHILDDEESAQAWLAESVENALSFYEKGEKGLVFCRSHTTTEKLASLLGCPSYYRDGRTVDELKIVYDRFLEDDDQKIIVATSLLGAGVDIPHVRQTWHFGMPYCLISCAQETGRGGRDGKPAYSHVISWRGQLERTPQETRYTEDAMREWVVQTSECRRTLFGQILDNIPTSCVLLRQANRCDFCRVNAKRPRPPSQVTFFRDPMPIAPPRTPPVPACQMPDPRPNTPTQAPPGRTHQTSTTFVPLLPRDVEPEAPSSTSPARALSASKAQESLPVNGVSGHQKRKSGVKRDLEGSGKRPRTTSARPPIIAEMESELYEKLRASDRSVEVGDDDAEDENILQPALASDTRTGVAKRVVSEIRTVLEEMEHGFGLQDCSVCFSVCGRKAVDHYSGSRCPQFLCGASDDTWKRFKELLMFRSGYLCFRCLLPTAANTNAPGARYHHYDACTSGHLIRPALYAFWVKAPSELRDYVTKNLGMDWSSLEDYASWCVASDRVNDLPNHLLLFWCIVKYWRSNA